MSNPEPTRNHDPASFAVPSPSFVAVRYFKVRGDRRAPDIARRPAAALKKSHPEKSLRRFLFRFPTTEYFASRQPHPTRPKENSVKDQRHKKRSTAGPGVMFAYARDIRLSQEQKGKPLNYFICPYAEANGQPIKG
jgi:hypothetical protein